MREPAQFFQDLTVWQKALVFTLAVYRCAKTFPANERFGLISQLGRRLSPVRRTLPRISVTAPIRTKPDSSTLRKARWRNVAIIWSSLVSWNTLAPTSFGNKAKRSGEC